jgi:LuxR family maltose regulon positive regulatory protein
VEEAQHVKETSGVFPEAAGALELAQVKLWLAQGNLQTASRWAASVDPRWGAQDSFRFEDEPTHLARARVWIAEGKTGQALELLSCLEEPALTGGRMGRVIEILMLRALALRRRGDSSPALAALEKCLELAGPEGYSRLFLDEGQTMQALLMEWLPRSRPGPVHDFAAGLLSAFGGSTLSSEAVAGKASANQLIDRLSQRELEVLQLMALGCTNQEIAGQLVVAPGTIKAHTASIYRKLDVANRTGAVARARQLGLLP